MSKTFKICLLVVCLVGLTAFVAVGLAAAPVKITVMYNMNELSTDQIKAFEAANPDIKVDFIQTDWNRAMEMSTGIFGS